MQDRLQRENQKAYADEYAFRKIQLTWLTRLLLGIAFFSAGSASASVPDTQSSAASLLAKYASLGERLHQNPIQRALVLDSSASADDAAGDNYALVNYPFDAVS